VHVGLRGGTVLTPSYIVRGGKLVEGSYWARYRALDYLSVTVQPGSPETLIFRLPPQLIYRGKVVDGPSGEPIAGGFVIAMSSVGRNNLALLNDTDWEQLATLPSGTSPDDAGLKQLRTFYGFKAFARTETDGTYELRPTPGEKIYSIIAFAQNRLPFKQRVISMKADETHQLNLEPMPLYPAAKAIVTPEHPADTPSVGHEWVVKPGPKPAWAKSLETFFDDSNRGFERLHWLSKNQAQPLYLPAEVPIAFRFHLPYDPQWTVDIPEKTLLLETGETGQLGPLRFIPSLEVPVRVVDQQERPVEGIPVRYQDGRSKAWRVAHNTDEKGEARFYVSPGHGGLFAVIDFPRDAYPEGRPDVSVPVRLDGPAEPKASHVIRMTEIQIEQILKSRQ
ncbi:MAG: hypothetical protein AAF492_20435, partial [Verrucomicrobiota bacterium]